MNTLKKLWKLWSDILTFAWVDRLAEKHRTLGGVVRGLLFTIGFGVWAWYYLDPRIIIYEKYRYVPINWAFRILYGSLMGSASLISLYFTFCFFYHAPQLDKHTDSQHPNKVPPTKG